MASNTKRTWTSDAGTGKKKVGGRRTGESWQVAYTEADGRRVKKAGFRTVRWKTLTAGIVAIHIAVKN